MQAKDIMSVRLEMVNRRATLQEAARKMAELRIGILPVVDRSHIVGIITDRDLVIRAMARGVNPASTEVDLIMTQEVVTCSENASLEDVTEKMEANGLRRLLVVSEKNKPVGIISIEDLASRATDKALASTALYRRGTSAALELWTKPLY